MTLRRLASLVEAAVGVVVVITVVMLFTNQPTAPPAGAPVVDAYGRPVESADGQAVDGAAIFGKDCAACHGGDGSGGLGPPVAGGAVIDRFPDEAEQVAFVTAGSGAMPAFGDRLSEEEIAAVVAYTRTAFADS